MRLAVDQRVEVGHGVRLHVRHRPGPAALSFLLVHGLASNSLLWEEVANRLTDHPVYAVDLRSHGESDAPDGGYDTNTAAGDLAALCSALALDRVIAVGQSWGGNVVVRLAARYPEHVVALALVDGGWIDLRAEFATWEECETALRPANVDGLPSNYLYEQLSVQHPDWSPTAVAATVASLRTRPDGTLQRRLPIPKHLAIVRSMWDDPPWSDYPAISVPVLLMPAVPGEPDAAQHRRERVGKAAASLTRARLREYVGADHDIHAQQPAALAVDLLALAAEV